ncbi:porin [Bartonella vinsonii]|uniref:Hemin binding protein n=1 Tax=Bartonella vinsonii subsp. berkhoffii str. Tweed TaxID=1094502 RepID=N6VVZ1_BARVB|nr:outer membrane protein [Bartonella vinsonii]ENN95302.1 hemin binding protein [Bartonella vinsonii subsp. berkhoffii str. Tweed]
MNIKSLITTSVIALASASAVQAADVIIPHEAAPVISAPAFSWTGFYIGGQVGSFSSKVEITEPSKNKLNKDLTPKPSGFMGGVYAGSNIELGNNLILGVETDAVWADREETKERFSHVLEADELDAFKGDLTQLKASPATGKQIAAIKTGDKRTDSSTLKEKWSGATRVRIGFAAADHIMPYVAGGVAYAQMQGTYTIKATEAKGNAEIATAKLFDATKTFVGYTLGGGVDIAMTDNVLLRAEYRYSDYGKKQFDRDKDEFSYKTNDFRVGVAYKF